MLRKTLLAVAILALFFAATVFWSYRGAVSDVPLDTRVIALTYDDGPNPPHTQALLELLDAEGVKATFFVKARNVEAFPDVLRAVARAGHEIGNHSYDHRAMTDLGSAAVREEVERAGRVIADVLGYAPGLFRPPYGLQGPGLQRALAELELPSILMSTHGLDWEHTIARDIADAVLEDVEPGSIVLLHDGHGDVDDPRAQDSRAATVAATKLIIDTLRDRGYTFVTISQLLALGGLDTGAR